MSPDKFNLKKESTTNASSFDLITSPERKPNQIEVKKLSLSSSSSSSSPIAFSKKASNTGGENANKSEHFGRTSKLNNLDDDDEDDLVSDKLLLKKQSKPERKNESSTYDDDFENSIKSDISYNSDI